MKTTNLQRASLALTLMIVTSLGVLASGDTGITDGCGYEKISLAAIKSWPKSGPCFPLPMYPKDFPGTERIEALPGYAAGYFNGHKDMEKGSYDREKEVPASTDSWSQAFAAGYRQAGLERPQDRNN